jgi:hypothetical protein
LAADFLSGLQAINGTTRGLLQKSTMAPFHGVGGLSAASRLVFLMIGQDPTLNCLMMIKK